MLKVNAEFTVLYSFLREFPQGGAIGEYILSYQATQTKKQSFKAKYYYSRDIIRPYTYHKGDLIFINGSWDNDKYKKKGTEEWVDNGAYIKIDSIQILQENKGTDLSLEDDLPF